MQTPPTPKPPAASLLLVAPVVSSDVTKFDTHKKKRLYSKTPEAVRLDDDLLITLNESSQAQLA